MANLYEVKDSNGFESFRVSARKESGTLQRVKSRSKLTRYNGVVMLVYRFVGKLKLKRSGRKLAFNILQAQELEQTHTLRLVHPTEGPYI